MLIFVAQSEIWIPTVSAESFILEATTEALMPLSKAANKLKDEKDVLDDSYEKWVCVKALEDIKHWNVCRWNQYLDTSALADRGLFSILVLPVPWDPDPSHAVTATLYIEGSVKVNVYLENTQRLQTTFKMHCV